MSRADMPTIGVVIVTYASGGEIVECLETLLAAGYPALKVVIVDNASPDDTVQVVSDWASGAVPFTPPARSPVPLPRAMEKPVEIQEITGGAPELSLGRLSLLRRPVNGGFAAGVNAGLRALRADGAATLFWILNPDSVVPAGTPAAFAAVAAANPGFGMMGGRILFYDDPATIQADGGRINMRTGITGGVNFGCRHANTPLPGAGGIDFISGAHLLVSQAFLAAAGPMREEYFLYYEETDWALRRGNMALVLAPGAELYHHSGASIGSGTVTRRPSGFSNYFMFRNRQRLLARFAPQNRMWGFIYSALKIASLLMRGAFSEAHGALAGFLGLRPPKAVRDRIPDPDAARLAFGRGPD